MRIISDENVHSLEVCFINIATLLHKYEKNSDVKNAIFQASRAASIIEHGKHIDGEVPQTEEEVIEFKELLNENNTHTPEAK